MKTLPPRPLRHGEPGMKTALITLSADGARLLAPLAGLLPEARLFVHESVRLEPDGLEGIPRDRVGAVPRQGGRSTTAPAAPAPVPPASAPGRGGREGDLACLESAGPRVERFARIAELTATLFPVCRNLVYAAPCGVVVRAIAPLIRSKLADPAVVVLDAGGRWAVSLLSGHEGGANDLAVLVANRTGAEPVVTTTTEALKSVVVGIGCRRGMPSERIVAAIGEALAAAGVALTEVRLLASAEVKADEAGLLAAAEALGVPIRFIPTEEIRASRRDFAHSAFVREKVGIPAVAEPAALLAGKRTRLIGRKKRYNGITIALAREGSSWPESAPRLL